MTALPASDAPAEERGRLAVSIPGFWWMPGMRWVVPSLDAAGRLHDSTEAAWWNDPRTDVEGESVPDPDDPATAGCLLALLGPLAAMTRRPDGTWWVGCITVGGDTIEGTGRTLGRACIAAAAALGCWPGGEQ